VRRIETIHFRRHRTRHPPATGPSSQSPRTLGATTMHELGVVNTTIQRPDPNDVAALSQYGSATIHEAMGRVGLMQPYLRPAYQGAKLCGPAVTALLQPGDNWMMHVAAEQLTDGGVGDAADLEPMHFPVFAKAIHARGTVKETLGSVNIPVVCAGEVVNPGDVVVADADGVVVVPREQVAEVAEAAQAREAKEVG